MWVRAVRTLQSAVNHCFSPDFAGLEGVNLPDRIRNQVKQSVFLSCFAKVLASKPKFRLAGEVATIGKTSPTVVFSRVSA